MEMKRLLLIINPVSGKKAILRYLPQVIRTFMDAGCLVTVMVTSLKGEATEFAAQYARDFDLVVCSALLLLRRGRNAQRGRQRSGEGGYPRPGGLYPLREHQ